MLEGVVIFFYRDLPDPGDQAWVSALPGRLFQQLYKTMQELTAIVKLSPHHTQHFGGISVFRPYLVNV